MILGYEPARVAALRRHTCAALDGLRRMWCADPDAAEAIAAAAQVAEHLDRLWLPLIDDIETSDALVSGIAAAASATLQLRSEWASTNAWLQTAIPEHRRHDRWQGTGPNRFRSLTNEALLEAMYHDGLEHGVGVAWGPTDFDDPYWDGLAELAAELARRTRVDAVFAALVVDRAPISPIVGLAVQRADFDPAFVGRLVVALLHGPATDTNGLHRVHGPALDAAMHTLLHLDAGVVLDVLGDEHALRALAGWPGIDDALLRRFVFTGLHESVRTGQRTALDGLEVIEQLVVLTNGDFDGGIRPGLARGVADSMFGYVHPIAHGIGATHDGSIVFKTDHDGFQAGALGTFADMRDFFGALLRDPEARHTLSLVSGAYTAATVERLGPRLFHSIAADDPILFGHLLDAAVGEELYEIEMAAAANRARYDRFGSLIGFGTGVTLTAVGVHSILREIMGRSGTIVIRATGPSDSGVHDDRGGDRGGGGERPSIAEATGQGIVLSVLHDAAHHPSRRADYGVDGVAQQDWDTVVELLDGIEVLPPGPARTAALHDLRNHIERSVPALDVVLDELDHLPGMNRLQVDTDPRRD